MTAMQNEQTPAAGPLTAESVKLLKRNDWLLPTISGAKPKQFDHVGATLRGTPLLFLVDGGSCLASVATFLGRPDQDGWIAWHGGENPVPGVKIDWRNKVGGGGTWLSDEVAGFGKPLNGNHRIIAYRPHAPSPASSSSVVQGDASGVEPAHVKVGAAYWRGEVTADQVASTIQDQAAKQTSRPQPSGEARVRELTDQLSRTERDYSELRESYDAVVAKLTIERGCGDKQSRQLAKAKEALERIASEADPTRFIEVPRRNLDRCADIAHETLAALQQAGEVG